MRYLYNKYAMPVDPRVLQHDFESDGSNVIPKLLKLLRKIGDHYDFRDHEKNIRNWTNRLWFDINTSKGINLREREQLLPIFEEYHRIFKQFEDVPSVLHRGLTLPAKVFKTPFISESIDPSNDPEVIGVLENLAYGLRSWTRYINEAITWANYKEQEKHLDSVVFKYRNPDYVFDCDAYFKVMYDFLDQNNIPLYKYPFDQHEVICFLKDPEIKSISQLGTKSERHNSHIWLVEVM